jgi:hypothetical protein
MKSSNIVYSSIQLNAQADSIKIIISQNDLPCLLSEGQNMVYSVDTEFDGLNVIRDDISVVQILDLNQKGGHTCYIVLLDKNPQACPNLSAFLRSSAKKLVFYGILDVTLLKKALRKAGELDTISNVVDLKILNRFVRTYTSTHGYTKTVRLVLGVDIAEGKAAELNLRFCDISTLSKDSQLLTYLVTDVYYLEPLYNALYSRFNIPGFEMHKACFDKLMGSMETVADLLLLGLDLSIFAHQTGNDITSLGTL